MNLELRPCKGFNGGAPDSVTAPFWIHLARISNEARLLHLFLTMHLRDGWAAAEGWALAKLVDDDEGAVNGFIEELLDLGALTRAPDGVLTVEQNPPDGYTGPLTPEELDAALEAGEGR